MLKTVDDWMRLLMAGDRSAYSSIFREFYGPLLSYSMRFTQERDASEDIVQEFFCKLWEERARLKDGKSFKSYLYISVRNRSLNYLRNNRAVSIEGYDDVLEDDFLLEIMEEEVYKELYAAIQSLPERCRQVMMLKLEENSNDEIAAQLQISGETVRSQLRHGREILQEKLTSLFALLVLYSWVNF